LLAPRLPDGLKQKARAFYFMKIPEYITPGNERRECLRCGDLRRYSTRMPSGGNLCPTCFSQFKQGKFSLLEAENKQAESEMLLASFDDGNKK